MEVETGRAFVVKSQLFQTRYELSKKTKAHAWLITSTKDMKLKDEKNKIENDSAQWTET